MSLTIRNRIFLILVPLLLLVIVFGVSGVVLLSHLGGASMLILRENYDSIIDMARLNEAVGVENDGTTWDRIFGTIEEIETDTAGVSAEDGEVNTVTPQVCTERQGDTRTDRLDFALTEQPFQLTQLIGTGNPIHRNSSFLTVTRK